MQDPQGVDTITFGMLPCIKGVLVCYLAQVRGRMLAVNKISRARCDFGDAAKAHHFTDEMC